MCFTSTTSSCGIIRHCSKGKKSTDKLFQSLTLLPPRKVHSPKLNKQQRKTYRQVRDWKFAQKVRIVSKVHVLHLLFVCLLHFSCSTVVVAVAIVVLAGCNQFGRHTCRHHIICPVQRMKRERGLFSRSERAFLCTIRCHAFCALLQYRRHVARARIRCWAGTGRYI